MSLPASRRARGLGITTTYKNLLGISSFLPQRLGVLAQGTTAAAGYGTTKTQYTTAYDVGVALGFGSPAHLIALELWPEDGRPGIGSIPVEFFPLVDGTTEASGDITPSGTSTLASTYYVRAGGIESDPCTIAAGALATAANLTAACKAMYDACVAVVHFPLTMGYTYGTVTDSYVGTGDGTLSSLTATTPCTPGDWLLVCTAEAVDSGTFSLTDPNGTVISTTITMGVNSEAGLGFTLTDGTEDFDIDDTFTINVPALTVTGVSKWKGASANGIEMEVVDTLEELTFTITQPTGGATNPTVDAALAQIGNTWTTMLLNALEIADTTALAAIALWGEGRWDTTVYKPAICFTGVTDATVAAATTISAARTTDRVNSQLVEPGSLDLPFRAAARELVEIIKQADEDPASGPAKRSCLGLRPGTDAQQWTDTQRDVALKAGSSTIEVVSSIVKLSDTVTMYAPSGQTNPAYRYVVDITKLQNIIKRFVDEFDSEEWAEKALVPDIQKVRNPNAKKPSMVVAAARKIIDECGLDALISAPETVKANTVGAIDSQNPKRWNLTVPVLLSGNTNIGDIDLQFGFYVDQTV
jgi:phage tail sheath gpL-like